MRHLSNPRLLWLRYALALGLVLALLSASHGAMIRALSKGTEDASTINIAGAQRMLSQRILYLAHNQHMEPGDTTLLEAAIDRMEASHYALSRGGRLGLSRQRAAERVDIYFTQVDGLSLDWLTREFIAAARTVSAEAEIADADWDWLARVGPNTVLDRLNRAVTEFESFATARAARARTIANLTFALALLILAAEALLIFWPAQRIVTRSIDGLQAGNAALDAARRRAEDARAAAEAAREEAEAARASQARFLSHMSHELRTPLNGVIGMLTAMSDRPERIDRTYLETARAASGHLLGILNGVLDLAKMDSGAMRVERAPFDPGAVIGRIGALFHVQAAQKGLALEVDPAADLPASIEGDETRVAQILANLVGNAVKFTEAGGVTVRAAYDPTIGGGTLRLEVEDTGIGIPPAERAAIFDDFHQTDVTLTRRHEGTGLGLSISRRFADLMGGTLAVHDADGGGSRFVLTLPAPPVASGAGAAEAGADPPAERAAQDLRVLVVDDGATNRMVAGHFLRSLGHRVETAADGREAVALVAGGAAGPGAGAGTARGGTAREPADADRAERDDAAGTGDAGNAADGAGAEGFDLILMDIRMPELDGFGALRAIRALPPPRCDVPVVALTAGDREETEDAASGARFDGHLRKPLDRDALDAALSALAGRRPARAPGAGTGRAAESAAPRGSPGGAPPGERERRGHRSDAA